MDDYKTRLLNEYLELKERYDKLHKFLIRYEAGTLEITITTNYFSLLERQCNLMGHYLKVLEIRMEIDGILGMTSSDSEVKE